MLKRAPRGSHVKCRAISLPGMRKDCTRGEEACEELRRGEGREGDSRGALRTSTGTSLSRRRKSSRFMNSVLPVLVRRVTQEAKKSPMSCQCSEQRDTLYKFLRRSSFREGSWMRAMWAGALLLFCSGHQ